MFILGQIILIIIAFVVMGVVFLVTGDIEQARAVALWTYGILTGIEVFGYFWQWLTSDW